MDWEEEFAWDLFRPSWHPQGQSPPGGATRADHCLSRWDQLPQLKKQDPKQLGQRPGPSYPQDPATPALDPDAACKILLNSVTYTALHH